MRRRTEKTLSRCSFSNRTGEPECLFSVFSFCFLNVWYFLFFQTERSEFCLFDSRQQTFLWCLCLVWIFVFLSTLTFSFQQFGQLRAFQFHVPQMILQTLRTAAFSWKMALNLLLPQIKTENYLTLQPSFKPQFICLLFDLVHTRERTTETSRPDVIGNINIYT